MKKLAVILFGIIYLASCQKQKETEKKSSPLKNQVLIAYGDTLELQEKIEALRLGTIDLSTDADVKDIIADSMSQS